VKNIKQDFIEEHVQGQIATSLQVH